MKMKRYRGFTLVELLIALAVASILIGVGVPSFIDVVRNARIGAQTDQVSRALFIARSEAVKSGEFVVVCARSAPETNVCGDEDDWRNGWLVFVDVDSAVDADAAVEAGDTLIATEPALVGENTMQVYARIGSGTAPQDVGHVRYLPRGDTDWESGSVVVCDKQRGSARSRAVNVRLTGDIQRARPNGSEQIPRDAFGALLDCGDGT